MKGATLTGFTLVALALCCGPCRGCCCSGALTDQFTDQLTDKLTEKVTEIAVQEGAEYAFEQIYGPDAHVELDISDRHASITKPGVKMDLWAMPETLPSRSQWPNPSNVTYIYDVEAEVGSGQHISKIWSRLLRIRLL